MRMDRFLLWIVVVVSAAVPACAGDGTGTFSVELDPALTLDGPDPSPFEGLALSLGLGDYSMPALSLLGFDIGPAAWSDVSIANEGISQLRVEPSAPMSWEEVSVTITGWKPSPELVVERTTLRVEENEIWLDLYWHTQPLLPPAPGPGADSIVPFGQFTGFGLPVMVVPYDSVPSWSMPFEYTERLGTFSPGTYVLHVTNHSPMSGSASTSFTVLSPIDAGDQPLSWWYLMQGGQ